MSPVLSLDPNDSICMPCATALGGKPIDKIATASVQACAHCHEERPCEAVRDYVWPAEMRRHAGKPWQAQTDELASLLGEPK